MYKIMYGLLDSPYDAVFAAPTRIGLRGHTLKIHQQRSPPICVQRSSSPVLEQVARGYCDRYTRGGIKISTGRTTAVPLPRSSSLTRPPIEGYVLPSTVGLGLHRFVHGLGRGANVAKDSLRLNKQQQSNVIFSLSFVLRIILRYRALLIARMCDSH